ncbi:unnamed protein product [Rodentolepis nana]|uniref:DUF5727 domain-containing protein n=1 Tax=Rodentolepis nana TaxID=102285 RepID=A0A0R3TWH0_RODNA|nr:unnamed protein product [Rodentolepis nana]
MFALFTLDAEGQEVYGSRVVTTNRGQVGPLKFAMSAPPEGIVRYKKGDWDELFIDWLDDCLIRDEIVGRPCNFDKGLNLATIFLYEVYDYQYIEVTDGIYVYMVFFTDACQFPPPKSAHLTTDNTTLISDVTIKLNKGVNSFVTYKWGTNVSSVAITLDWMNSGISPEVNECQGKIS